MANDLVLTVILKADASGMQNGFSQASSAMGQFKQAADSTGNSAGGFGAILGNLGIKLPTFDSAMKGIASVAGGVFSGALGLASQGVGMLKGQLSDTIQVAEQHQTIMSQTTQAIKSTGDACGLSAQAVEGLAESLSKTTTFSEDTIQSGENLMLTFTGIGKDVFPQTTQTMLDMAQAMHMGPTQAAMQLGKALNDPAKGLSALTREGVTFSDSEKTMIKQMVAAGNTAGAQKIMLKELQTEFGGSAQAAGKTFAGSLQVLKNNLEDVKIKVGTAVLPIISQMTSMMSSIAIPILDRFGDWFSQTIAPLLQGFSDNVAKAFNYVKNVLRTIDLSDFTDAWTDVKSAVVELGQAFQVLGAKLHPVAVDFDPLANTIAGLAKGALGILTNMLWKAYEAISAVSGIFLGGKGPLEDFGNSLKQIGAKLQPTAAILGGQFKTDLAWLGNTFNQIGAWVKSSLMPALATLVPPFMSIADTIAKNILPAFAEFYATGHQLFESMLTPLIGVLENILPPIISIAGWLAGALAEGFKFVAPLVKGLADAISGLVNFFTKTQVGGDILKATLITLSIPVGILALAFMSLAFDAIVAFITSIPAMVGGFLAGAASAWTMAMGVLALTWPILVVIAVIALIILAIQHWGDIVNWLKGAWGDISSWFGGILDGIKGAWGSISSWFSVQLTKVKALFTWLWVTIQADLQKAWQSIQNAVKMALGILVDIIMGPIYAIVNGFVWLYNHNYYFKDLVDSIVNFFKGCFAWIQGAWTTAINWLVGAWNDAVKFATSLWQKISMTINAYFSLAVVYVQSIWNQISTFFVNAWNTYIAGPLIALWTTVSTFFSNVWTNYIVNPLIALWTNVSNFFSNVWTNYIVNPLIAMWTNVSNFFSNVWTNYIAGPIGDLWNQLSSTVSGWATKALDWGKNLIQGFVNGIINKANSVAGAVGGIAGQVLAFLGFHSPTKEGPGREADIWAPNFVKMYSEGLEAGLPQIQKAVNKLSTPLMLSLNPATSNYKAASAPPNFKYPAAGTGSGSSAPIVVNVHPVVNAPDIYMDHKKVTDIVATQLANKIRMKGGVRAH